MFKEDKKLLVLTSLIILLPILPGWYLWSQLSVAENGWNPSIFVVFSPPLSMLAAHLACIFATSLDRSNTDQTPKVRRMVLWICPALSIVMSAITYAMTLDVEVNPERILVLALGLMFAFIGNYLPKTKMNSTIGIKVPWTYSSEENWNATHRFSGKVWVIGGIVIMLSALLPVGWGCVVMLISVFGMVFVSIGYSAWYYRREKQAGKVVTPPKMSRLDAKLLKGSLVFLVLLFTFVGILLFTGDIRVNLEEESFTVEASYYSDLTVRYDAIENLEYREGNVPGVRTNGFGSFRLLMGWFRSDELGTYTRYTYCNPESCILMTVRGKTLVLSVRTAAETRQLYDALLAKIS
ncbi:MAG: SdpI family protein [Faecousia sp.]